jgi:predicted GNAT family acetyltransferase
LISQRVEHDGIDALDAVDTFLEICRARPVGEGLSELALVTERRESVAQLSGERVVDREPVLGRCHPEDLVVQAEEALKLGDRVLVVVHSQIDDDVRKAGVAGVLLDQEE